jgi:hypothetical protein
MKTFDFMRSTNFYLLSQIRVNSINNFDFVQISAKGDHCHYSPQEPKIKAQATPLYNCSSNRGLFSGIMVVFL